MPTIFSESFETDGNGTRYVTSAPEFTDGVGDLFTRTDGSNIGSFYEVSGQDGSFWFAAMDLNGDGAAADQTLTISGIDISGLENLSLDVLVAEDDDGSSQDWDADSQLLFEVSIDGGAFQSLLAFEAEAGTNTEPRLDTDFDGLGHGTALSPTFANFNALIAGTGSSLGLRISFIALDAGDEDVSIDNIRISGDAAGAFNLQITEIWSGQEGADLTEDWFEITNAGDVAWVSGVDSDLFTDRIPGTARVLDFNALEDTIDVSAWGTHDFSELLISSNAVGDRVVVRDIASGDMVSLIEGDIALAPADLTEDSFIFADLVV